MLVIRKAGIHKMLVRTTNREDTESALFVLVFFEKRCDYNYIQGKGTIKGMVNVLKF